MAVSSGGRPERNTAIDQQDLRESLLAAFREFDTLTTISFVAYIAGHWGGLVAAKDRHGDGRVMAEKLRAFIYAREPTPNRPSFFGGRRAGLDKSSDLGLEWAERLVKMPEDEALMALGEAFWEWLLTADLSLYRHEEDTDITVVRRAFQAWCEFASV